MSQRNEEHRIFPYFLRNLGITRPNQVWGIDITYIRLRTDWMYLVVILDWFSRYVVSWELDETLEMPFVLAAVSLFGQMKKTTRCFVSSFASGRRACLSGKPLQIVMCPRGESGRGITPLSGR